MLEKDKIKDDLMKSLHNLFNYIKIVNKDYSGFNNLIKEENTMFRPIQCLETPKSREQQLGTFNELYKLIDDLNLDLNTEATRATSV